MEFTRQPGKLTISTAMPQKALAYVKESTQSNSNRLGAFGDAEKVPSGNEMTPFPHVEHSNEGTLDTRRELTHASELANKQEASTLGDMGDLDSLSLLSPGIHMPAAAIGVDSDATAKVKSCSDSVPESPDYSGQMDQFASTVIDEGRQCINGAHTPSGDASELTVGMDRFDHLENFWNRKVKAEATKNAIDDAGDKIRKDQVSIPNKKCELLEKQPLEHVLGAVSSRKNATCKQGTVSEATRRKIQQLERELTMGTTLPECHVSRKSQNKKHSDVEESPPPPPPGTRRGNQMPSSQNTVPPLRDKGIDDNGVLELSDLKEELSRAKEQICMLEACLKQSRADTTCQDGEKWKPGSNNELEILIQGYQKENERLVEKLKELKSKHENEKLSLYEERRQLGCQLNLLQNQVARQSVGKGAMSTNAESLRCQLTLEAKVLHLQEQLEQERKEHAVLMSMGTDRKPIQQQPLEDELASASVLRGEPEEMAQGENSSSQSQLETTAMVEVRSLQDEIAVLRRSHEAEVAELKQKMQWYVENGELVDRHITRLAEQDKEIERLKCARAESLPRSSKSCSRCVTSCKTIAKLKTQLVELENASMKRNPDNVSSLIRAAKLRSDSSQKEASIRKINALEKELEKAKEDGIVRIRALRQEHERVCACLRKRLTSEANIKADEKENFGGTKNSSNSSTSGKPLRDESEELDRMKQFYKKKLRKAEQKIMLQAAKIRRLSFAGGSTSTSPQHEEPQQVKLGVPASSEQNKNLVASPSKKAEQSTHEKRIAALEEKLSRTTEELCSSKATIDDLIAASAAPQQRDISISLKESVVDQKGGVLKSTVNDSEPIHQPSSGQAQSKKSPRISRIPVPQAECQSFSGLTDTPRLMASEETCKALRHQVMELQKEISDFKAREKFQSLPVDIKCNALAEQLNAVQRRAEARSLEVAHAVDSVRNDARIEMATVQAKHKVELHAKAAEIDGLRRELDELISHLGSLKVRSTVTRAPG